MAGAVSQSASGRASACCPILYTTRPPRCTIATSFYSDRQRALPDKLAAGLVAERKESSWWRPECVSDWDGRSLAQRLDKRAGVMVDDLHRGWLGVHLLLAMW